MFHVARSGPVADFCSLSGNIRGEWSGAVRCGLRRSVWCCVVWCGVVWCAAVRCGVVWMRAYVHACTCVVCAVLCVVWWCGAVHKRREEGRRRGRGGIGDKVECILKPQGFYIKEEGETTLQKDYPSKAP